MFDDGWIISGYYGEILEATSLFNDVQTSLQDIHIQIYLVI